MFAIDPQDASIALYETSLETLTQKLVMLGIFLEPGVSFATCKH